MKQHMFRVLFTVAKQSQFFFFKQSLHSLDSCMLSPCKNLCSVRAEFVV